MNFNIAAKMGLKFNDKSNSDSNRIIDDKNENNINPNKGLNYLQTDVQRMPPSPQLNINRMAYNLPDFNATYRRKSQLPGFRPKSVLKNTENILEKVKSRAKCKSPLDLLKSYFPIIVWLKNYEKKDLI